MQCGGKTKYYNTSVKMCANACKCQMYSANLKWLGIVMIGGENVSTGRRLRDSIESKKFRQVTGRR